MSDNEKVVVVLLPGMDGTGTLFGPFLRLLPDGYEVTVVAYPEDKYLTYQQLAERVMSVVPNSAPYVIIAESYSGPVASILAAHPVGDLRAVVFVSSFATLPCGRVGSWAAGMVPTALFRIPAPAWILKWFLMDSDTSPEMVSAVRDAIARVRPDVLTQRLQSALNADFSAELQHCTVRIICLFSESDRLLGTRNVRGFLAAKSNIETMMIAGPHLLLQCAPNSSLAALRTIGILGDPIVSPRNQGAA